MTNLISNEDREFKRLVEMYDFPVQAFDHRSHIRLAYIYLANNDVKTAVILMRDTLTGLLKHVGIEPSEKYHETLTEAWILAVNHFINKTGNTDSSDDFIEKNPIMLDSKIMLTHYSAEVLFSDLARQRFVEPNLDPIPKYED